MATGDKLVTLDDLKAAYDDLKKKVDMWEDITDSLTWQQGLRLYQEKAVTDATGYYAVLSVRPGERYRISLWKAGSAYPVVAIFSSVPANNVSYISYYWPENNSRSYTFETLEPIYIPKQGAYLMISDRGPERNHPAGDVIVEKAIR